MQTLKDLKAGDEVMVEDVNFPARKARVHRVGSKNIYLNERIPAPYCLESGRRKDSYGHQRIVTMDQWTYQKRVDVAYGRLRSFGVDLNQRFLDDNTALAIYDAVLPLIEAKEAKAKT